MITKTSIAAVAFLAILSDPSMAQLAVHTDGGGYTYRSSSGNWTNAYRYDTGATYNRIGNFATYSDNTGTSGWSYYGPHGRHDSYSNYEKGWTGSGYTPNDTPELTTYRRTSTKGSWGWLGLGAGGAGIYGLRRFTRICG
jgi:hypothetical protein